jgi:hypothetical protein
MEDSAAAVVDAPSILPTQAELLADIEAKLLEAAVAPTRPARANEAAD